MSSGFNMSESFLCLYDGDDGEPKSPCGAPAVVPLHTKISLDYRNVGNGNVLILIN